MVEFWMTWWGWEFGGNDGTPGRGNCNARGCVLWFILDALCICSDRFTCQPVHWWSEQIGLADTVDALASKSEWGRDVEWSSTIRPVHFFWHSSSSGMVQYMYQLISQSQISCSSSWLKYLRSIWVLWCGGGQA